MVTLLLLELLLGLDVSELVELLEKLIVVQGGPSVALDVPRVGEL